MTLFQNARILGQLEDFRTFSSFPIKFLHFPFSSYIISTIPIIVIISSRKYVTAATDEPHISLHATNGKELRREDGYNKVSTADLEIPLRQGREAVLSVEGELMKGQPERNSNYPIEVRECCQRLYNTAG